MPDWEPDVDPPPAKKRKNTSRKGQVVELTAIKVLEAEGYKVHRCVRTGVKRGPFYFSQSNDVYGCIDLIAKKIGERTRWIQVTADSGMGRKFEEMLTIPWDIDHDTVEVWRWVGGQKRKHKVTGEMLDRQFFHVHRLLQATTLTDPKLTSMHMDFKDGAVTATVEGTASKVQQRLEFMHVGVMRLDGTFEPDKDEE